MYRQYQYDVFTEGLPPAPEVVEASSWVQPQSQPIPNNFVSKLKAGVVAALVASGIFYTALAPQVVTASGISADCSFFVINRSYAAQIASGVYSVPFVPAAAAAAGGSGASQQLLSLKARGTQAHLQTSTFWSAFTPSAPSQGGGFSAETIRLRFQRRFASQSPSVFWNTFTPATAITPVIAPCAEYPDSFYKKRYLTEALDSSDGQAVIGTLPPSIQTAVGGAQGKSTVIRINRSYAAQIASGEVFVPVVAAPTPTGWLGDQNQLPRGKQSLAVAEQQAVFFTALAPQVVTASGISADCSFFVINRSYAYTSPSVFWNPNTPVLPPTGWLGDQNQPLPIRKGLAAGAQQYSPGVVQAGSTPSTFGLVCAEKQQVSQRYLAANQQAVFYTSFVQVSVLNWLPSYPDFFKPKFSAGLYIYSTQANVPVEQLASADYPDWIAGKKYLTSNQQAAFGPLSTSPETVFVSSWAQPQSQPYPYRRSLQTAQQIAVFWNTSTQPEVVESASWYPTYPQPFPTKPYLSTASQQYYFFGKQVAQEYLVGNTPVSQPSFKQRAVAVYEPASNFIFTPAQTFNAWLPAYPDKVYSRPYLLAAQQQAVFGPLSTDQETVFVSSYVQPQSQPYPYKRSLLTAQQQATFWNTSTATETVLVSSWVQPQSQPYPYRKAQLTANQQALFWNTSTQPETVFESSWQGVQSPALLNRKVQQPDSLSFVSDINLATVVLPDRRVTVPAIAVYLPCSTWLAQPTTQVFLDWQQPQSQPLSTRRIQPVDVVTVVPQHIGLDWQPVYPDAVIGRRFLTADQQWLAWNTSTQSETVFESSWQGITWQPWPAKCYLSAAQQQAFFWQPNTPGDFTFLLHWEPIYPQPFPKKLYPAAAQQQAVFWNTSTQPETVLVSSWVQPQSQPYPYKPYRPAALYPSVFWNTSTAPETVFVSSYVQPQTQPYPYKKAIQPCEQLTFVWEEATADEVSIDWVQPQSQPYSYRKVLTTAEQQATFWNTSTSPETVLVSSWVQPISQPYPYTKALQTANQQAAIWNISTQPETVLVSSWVQPQSQPYPYKRAELTANQPAAFWNTSTSPETITVDKWLPVYPQPFPVKQYILTANQQAFFWQPNTPGDFSYLYHWEPVYPQPFPVKRYLQTANVPAFFWNTSTQPESVLVSSWVQSQSQPYSYKPYRPASLYQSTFYAPFVSENVQVSSWVQAQSQPRIQQTTIASQTSFFWGETTSDAGTWYPVVSQQQVKIFARAVYEPAVSWNPNTPVQVTLDWLAVSEQQLTKRNIQQYASVFWNASTAPETVFISSWEPVIAQPVFTKPAQYQALFWSGFTPSQQVVILDWDTVYPQPAKQRFAASVYSYSIQIHTPVIQIATADYPDQIPGRQYLTANQQATFWDPNTTFGETVLVSSWVQPQSQPYPYTPYSPASVYPVVFWNTSINPETVFVSSWIQPIEQPYPFVKALQPTEQLTAVWSTFTPPPPVAPDFGWYQQVVQPYPHSRFLEALQQSVTGSNFPLPNAVTQFVQGTGFVTQVVNVQGSIENTAAATGSITTISGTGSVDQ